MKILSFAKGDPKRDLSCVQVRLCLAFRFGHSDTKFAVTIVPVH